MDANTDNPLMELSPELRAKFAEVARNSKSMTAEERAAFLSPEEANKAAEESQVFKRESALVHSLSTLVMGPDDTLIVKTSKDMTSDPVTAPKNLEHLNKILRDTFSSKFHNRILVIPHDMDVSKTQPKSLRIEFKKLSENAMIPVKAKAGDAAYDLFASEDGDFPPGQQGRIKTGISIAIPEGFYGRIAPRSGLAHKHGIDVMGGVIDSSFRGEIGVLLISLKSGHVNHDSFVIKRGDRIAQLIIERCYDADFVEVTELSETSRGAGGFGSTGS